MDNKEQAHESTSLSPGMMAILRLGEINFTR